MSPVRRVVPGVAKVLALLVLVGCATAAGFGAPEMPLPRLADGSPVPEDADYSHPVPRASFQPDLPDTTAGYRGLVEVDAVIGEDGLVTEVLPVSSTNDRLLEKVIARVRETPFQPARLDGEPVAVLYRITVRVTVQ